MTATLPSRLATLSELSALQALLIDAKGQMALAGFRQWDETYPTTADFRADILAHRLWWFGTGCDAALTITPVGATWHLHRVMVNSAVAHHGLASRMLVEVRDWARLAGIATLAVSTHHANLPMRGLLTRLGYRPIRRYLAPGRTQLGEFVSYQYSCAGAW